MNHLVRILIDDSGDKAPKPGDWHLVVNEAGSDMALCSGEVFGEGEGTAVFKEKQVKRGGVTCPDCLRRIRFFKQVRL